MNGLIVTDLHYTPGVTAGTRACGLSLEKMERLLPQLQKAQLRLNLGDLINGTGDPEKDLQAMKQVKSWLDSWDFYHICGNHDALALEKSVLGSCEAELGLCGKFSLEAEEGRVDFLVLDGNFCQDQQPYSRTHGFWTDTVIPEPQLRWLEQELEKTSGAVILCHQNLDARPEYDPHVILNSGRVRKLLEDSGKVKYVFQGHCHAGHESQINGLHYYTVKAMCEQREIHWCELDIRSWDKIGVTMCQSSL